MDNSTGENDAHLSNDSRPPKSGALVARSVLGDLVSKVVRPEEEVRKVRRGKFFVPNYDLQAFGSLRRPIWEYRFHGVLVGQTEKDCERDGIWCFGVHPDFELIPEFQKLEDWPEYERTETGFIRKGVSYLDSAKFAQRELGYEQEGEKK